MPTTKGMLSSERDDWETPPALFERLDKEFGFVLDAAASDENGLCDTYLTKEDDALTSSWDFGGPVFVNPPYGNMIGKFAKKAYEEAQKGTCVVMLCAARTDTRWWHDYVMNAGAIHFIKGRLKFVGAPHCSTFPSVIVVWEGDGWDGRIPPKFVALELTLEERGMR